MRTGFVDWGVDEHEVVLLDDEGKSRRLRVTHDACGMEMLRTAVVGHDDGRGVQVGLERRDGAIVDTLLEAGVRVFSINPKQVDRFREFLRVSGAKDDHLDALTGAKALQQYPEAFSELDALDPTIAELRECVRLREELTKEQLRAANRLREQLQRYYPNFLAATGGQLSAQWVQRLLSAAPTPGEAKKLCVDDVRRALGRARRSADEVHAVLTGETFAVPTGVLAGACRRALIYLSQLKLVAGEMTAVARRERELLDQWGTSTAVPNEPSDLEIIRSFPGMGPKTTPTLIAFGYRQLAERNARALGTYGGIRPVAVLTGKKQNRTKPRKQATARMRRSCCAELRGAYHHIGDTARQHDTFYAARYARSRARGHSHGRACRDLSEHLTRVLMACLKQRVLYDPARLLPAE